MNNGRGILNIMGNSYEECREIFLEECKNIRKKFSNNPKSLIANYSKLKESYKKVEEKSKSRSDKLFINFNYFLSCFLIFKSNNKKNAPLLYFLALKTFANYLKTTNADLKKWEKSINLYNIDKQYAEFDWFEDTNMKLAQSILKEIESTFKFAIDQIDSIILDYFKQIIQEKVLLRSKNSVLITENICRTLLQLQKNNDRAKKDSYLIAYKLRKNILYFYLRKLIPTNLEGTIKEDLLAKITHETNEMNRLAKAEYNRLKGKSSDLSYKFNVQIDLLMSEYFKELYVETDLKKAIRKLEGVLNAIGKNREHASNNLCKYIIVEYQMLQGFIKILYLHKEFENKSKSKIYSSWQQELFKNVSDALSKIFVYFKYDIKEIQERELIIVEKSTKGKLLEFVLYYLITEIAKNRKRLTNIPGTYSKEIQILLTCIFKIEDLSQIKWGYKVENTDIDIFLPELAIFFKTGNINNDIKKIHKEVKVTRKEGLGIGTVIYGLEIYKNTNEVKKLQNEDDLSNVIFVDIADFFYEIDKLIEEMKINIDIPKNSIKSLIGISSGL